MHQTAHKGNVLNQFFILYVLTFFLILVEISFFVQCNKAYLDDFSYVTAKIAIPFAILPGILFFILAQLFLHVMYVVFLVFNGLALKWVFNGSSELQDNLLIVLWIFWTFFIFLANLHYFPYSKFSELTKTLLLSNVISEFFFYVAFIIASILFLIVLIYFLYHLCSRKKYFLLSAIIFSTCIYFIFQSEKINVHTTTSEQPNVILIGIDSLRPDFLNYFGGDVSTPTLNQFLNEASVFTDAVTPLARTFPSWSSILTANYPVHSGIRFDLAKINDLHLTQTLATMLKEKNYRTVFATDESRFSNIDQQFGFEEIIAPPVGLNDFLIGSFNDFPLSNLLVNTVIGKWLFPYSYANRAAFPTYYPNTFLKTFLPVLNNPSKKPLFLAVHFCLPHTPYVWANANVNLTSPIARYTESIKKVDQQVGDFIKLLKQYGYLDHAFVIIFSDHGEAIALSGDRITEADLFLSQNKKQIPHFYPASLYHETVNQSAGHGTDVLGLSQYHSLLAFKQYGLNHFQNKNITQTVSLIDITPTILDLLHLPRFKTDGRSLADLILGRKEKLASQHLFLESDFSPEAIRTVYPETRLVILEGVQVFQIDPITTRLTVKPEMGEKIIQSKQFADIYGEWMLALYPQDKKSRKTILINLRSGLWTDDLSSNFALSSPAKEMYAELTRMHQIHQSY